MSSETPNPLPPISASARALAALDSVLPAVPPYSDDRTKFDMRTFWGRTRYWAEAINPLMMFKTEAAVRRDQQRLQDWRDAVAAGKLKVNTDPGAVGTAADAQLWRARRVVENCVHPTTGDVLFPLFRMCAYLPSNSIIVPFMMSPVTLSSYPLTLLSQWLNQSYNSAINYANRSSDAQPVSEIAKAYTAAVVIACGGSMGATALLGRVPPGTVSATLIRAFVPLSACVAAAFVNLGFMRKNEWMSGGAGIAVKDEDGTVRGKSVAAGRDSLFKCCVTRVVWCLPCMTIPTLLMIPLLRCSAAARRRPIVTETLLQIGGLGLGVPPALAVYDVNQTIPAASLEPQFQGLKRKNGQPVEKFSYYKGL